MKQENAFSQIIAFALSRGFYSRELCEYIVFSRDFLQAFYGEKIWKSCKEIGHKRIDEVNGWKNCNGSHLVEHGWEWHAKKQVLAKDPIEYVFTYMLAKREGMVQ